MRISNRYLKDIRKLENKNKTNSCISINKKEKKIKVKKPYEMTLKVNLTYGAIFNIFEFTDRKKYILFYFGQFKYILK